MLSDRFIVDDAQWALMEPHCLGKKCDPGRNGSDNRLFLEAALWIARTGAPWRDLPTGFGNWNTVFKRFRHWVKADVFKRIFDAVSDGPDMECVMIPSCLMNRVAPVRDWGCSAEVGPFPSWSVWTVSEYARLRLF